MLKVDKGVFNVGDGNPRINVHGLYKSLIQAALSDWQQESIFLALDTSMFWEEYCLVRLCVIHRGRALPVVWRGMKHSGCQCFLYRLSRDDSPGTREIT